MPSFTSEYNGARRFLSSFLGLRSFRSTAAPDTGGVFAVVEAVSADEYWLKVLSDLMGPSHTVIAFQFIRNVGGVAASDMGPPWPVFRRVGVHGLADVNQAHGVSTRLNFSSEYDTGARDAAFYSSAALKYVYSYHGGENPIGVQQGIPATGRQIPLRTVSIATDTLGNSVTVTKEVRVNKNGSVTTKLSAYSPDLVWTERLVAHEILSGATKYSLDDGSSYINIVSGVKTVIANDVVAAGLLRLRNPSNGTELSIVCDAHLKPGFLRYYIRQHAGQSRIKFYAEFTAVASVPLDIAEVTWTSSFRKTAADPVPFLNYDAERDGLAPGIMFIHAGADRITIDTSTTPDALLFNADATGAPQNSESFLLGITEVGNYRLEFKDVDLGENYLSVAGDANGGSVMYITKATNGSASTPAPISTSNVGAVIAAGYQFDFTVSDVTGDPIRLLIRQGRAAASANRFWLKKAYLVKLP